MCRKKLLQLQMNIATSHERVKAKLGRAVAITKERNSVSTKFEKLRLRVEQRGGFANKELARFVAELVKVTQEQDASVAKIEQLALEVPCAPSSAVKDKRLRERVSAL